MAELVPILPKIHIPGDSVGDCVGGDDGFVGSIVGEGDGAFVGIPVGDGVGDEEGCVGSIVGDTDGAFEGETVGADDGYDGDIVG